MSDLPRTEPTRGPIVTSIRLDLPRLLDRLSGARDHLLSHAGVIPKWILSRRD